MSGLEGETGRAEVGAAPSQRTRAEASARPARDGDGVSNAAHGGGGRERGLERLREEVRRGRLSGYLQLSAPSSISAPPTTLGELLDRSAPRQDGEDLGRAADELLDGLSYASADQELGELLAAIPPRQLAVLRARLHPTAPATLGEIGEREHVSRERIRQIEVKGRQALRAAVRGRPLLRARSAIRFARAAAERNGPDRVEAELKGRGLVESRSALEDLFVVWRALDLELPFDRDLFAAGRRGASPAQFATARAVRSTALELRRNCGAFELASLGGEFPEEDLRVGVELLGYSQILPGWYWRRSERLYTVESLARKLFSIAPRLRPWQLRVALARHLGRAELPVPPAEVIARVLIEVGWISMEGDDLVSGEVLRPEDELSGTELAFYRHLSKNALVAQSRELIRATEAAGLTRHVAVAALRQSAILVKVGPALYSLAGAPPMRAVPARTQDGGTWAGDDVYRLLLEPDPDGWYPLIPT